MVRKGPEAHEQKPCRKAARGHLAVGPKVGSDVPGLIHSPHQKRPHARRHVEARHVPLSMCMGTPLMWLIAARTKPYSLYDMKSIAPSRKCDAPSIYLATVT